MTQKESALGSLPGIARRYREPPGNGAAASQPACLDLIFYHIRCRLKYHHSSIFLPYWLYGGRISITQFIITIYVHSVLIHSHSTVDNTTMTTTSIIRYIVTAARKLDLKNLNYATCIQVPRYYPLSIILEYSSTRVPALHFTTAFYISLYNCTLHYFLCICLNMNCIFPVIMNFCIEKLY